MGANRVRVGVVGIGDIAQKAYLPILAVHPQVEVVGLMSRNEETIKRAADQYRIAGRFTQLEELLAQRPDVVFVHSATSSHYEVAMRCLASGVHVYVDKPLSCDIRESEEMAAEAVSRGKLLAVGFNRRFAPMVTGARQWLQEAGGPQTVLVQKNRTKPQRRIAKETLYDDAIHAIDLAMWLASARGGEAELAAATVLADEQGQLRSALGMLRERQSGCTAVFSMDRGAGLDSERIELHGSGRSAVVEELERAVLYGDAAGGQTLGFGGWDSHLLRRGFVGVVEHTLASLADPASCSISADKVLGSHYMVEKLAAYLEG
ncbi:virulence factor [Paenibacillus phyllosphaerae]|uniref:Virulence factor n=1 Tax=Paenibacillus phyllosphaerae TaxID=274593 RepID=A0A7W5B0J6_9BACL|nr:Gfo/Idh/MocA family oxidoreductase [Paenibacillus phyllosphaerae]MBB3112230.1 virulence factor [Paenibacillus phyllosphaerae]